MSLLLTINHSIYFFLTLSTPESSCEIKSYATNMKTHLFSFFCLLFFLSTLSAGATSGPNVKKDWYEKSIASQRNLQIEDTTSIRLDEVMVTSPQRSTNSRINTPSGNTLLRTKQLREMGFTTLNDLSSISPNVWIPRYGSLRSTSIYIRGIGSRSGTSSTSMYLNGSPIIYPANMQLKLPNLYSAEVLRGPQGTLYGRNSLAGVIRLETLSPFDPQLATATLSTGSHGLFMVNTSIPLYRDDRFAISSFIQNNRQRGFFYDHFRKEWADPLKELSYGMNLAWKISAQDFLRFDFCGGMLKQGAFPYRLYDIEKQEIQPLALNGSSSFERDNLLASLGYRHSGELYTLDLTTSFEALKQKTNMDQDYSPKEIFQMQMAERGRAFTAEALFKWHDQSKRHNLSVGASFFMDRNHTTNPILMGKDGIAMLLQPMLDKVSSNPKMPFNIAATNKEGESIALTYKKPRHGEAIYAQYTLEDLFAKGLSLTVGMHLGLENYAMTYDVASQFHFLASPKQKNPAMKPLPLAPKVNLVGNVHHQEFHFSPRVALGYNITPTISTYLAFSRGFRAGNYNEQAFADYLMQYEAKALMLAMQNKKLPPQPIEESLILYKPERGTNYEWGIRGSAFGNKLQCASSLFYTHINDLQVTDFVSSGLGRIQENFSTGKYIGAELELLYRPVKPLSLAFSYGYLYAKLKSGNKLYTIPYVPQHTLSAAILYSPQFDPKRFFFEELTLGLFCNANGPIQWNINSKLTEPFNAMLDAKIAVRRGIFSIWAKGYNLTNHPRTTFSFRSLGRSLMQTAAPLHFEIGITFAH